MGALVPELAVSDYQQSLHFYRDILGFSAVYERAEDGFAFLALGAAELMIDQIGIGRTFGIADEPIAYPLGRGVNLQIAVPTIEPLLKKLAVCGISLYLPLEDKWYRKVNSEIGQRQFVVPDPDGYLLRFCQDLGIRPAKGK
ncbi:VOC family protein [Devosia rhodophyticola]|uniref:Bleomycin resistance protein n=1 Tax=Devosia rhodophyticola TaxID=3026423 RepID=A0ABY7YYL3_9HYPH|nr:VOC family protein [Devosia rhodophyticola]WDR06464.1 VOC family protein [Devosia rhodophyticola]